MFMLHCIMGVSGTEALPYNMKIMIILTDIMNFSIWDLIKMVDILVRIIDIRYTRCCLNTIFKMFSFIAPHDLLNKGAQTCMK